MKFRPSFRALSTGNLLLLVLLYSAFVGILYAVGRRQEIVTLSCIGIVMFALLGLMQLLGVKLFVFSSGKNVVPVIENVFSTMKIDHHSDGRRIVLDRSGIETKVISIGFVSLVVVGGGKRSARIYLTAVVKKFINYRFKEKRFDV